MKNLLSALALLLALAMQAQDNGLISHQLNQTDTKGLKQGQWQKKYKNGNLAYDVRFKDGRPVGEYKRFHPNGTLKALLNYSDKGYASARFYDDQGKLVSEGFYQDEKKDSLWKYYSANDSLRMLERYRYGVLHGTCEKRYDNGQVAELETYDQGKQVGLWRQFYIDGKTRAECRYVDGKRDGVFNQFQPNGRYELKGRYVQDKRHGTWEYFDPTGKLASTIQYTMGQPDSASDQRMHDELIRQEQEGKKLVDPEKFINNPDVLLRGGGVGGGDE